MDELVKCRVDRSLVRVIKTWVPAHARHYDFLGFALEETDVDVLVAVYGYLDPQTKVIGVTAVKRNRPHPIPA